MKQTAYFCHNFAEIFKSNEYEKVSIIIYLCDYN